MALSAIQFLLLPASLWTLVLATPSPSVYSNANVAFPQQPVITASPVENLPTRTSKHKRDLFSSIESGIGSILSGLGSDIPSFVASGIPNFFQGFPTGDSVQSSLGLASSQIAAYPTQVLNISPYANFTSKGWNVRFHGNVYKQPDTSKSKLNDLANIFLIDVDIKDLPKSQQEQARNLTSEIFVLQQGDVNVSIITLESTTTGGSQDITLPYQTTPEGDFDVFVPIESNGLLDGDETTRIQTLQTYIEGASLGNSTAYLVPEEGLTVISDIDDILRVTKIYEPKQGLLNSFARPYRPWENMPQIYANWSASLPDMHFHYLTTTPEQVTRNYMQYIFATYPLGSFDTRPLNFSNIDETLKVRKYLLQKIFETFPKRKFILVADTSNSDVMSDYPAMVTEFPGQVQCIFLRNTSATDSGDKFPYDTSGFQGIKQSKYMFFVHPDDLTNLDIENGDCYNKSIPQNVTFDYQGLPFGLSDSSAASLAGIRTDLMPFVFLSFVLWQIW